jgi:hypothetical protein
VTFESTFGDENWCVDDIIAALEHNDRISEVDISNIHVSQLEKVLAAMQQPFPALTRLHLKNFYEIVSVQSLFLGGSAPRLQTLSLHQIPCPSLPELLLSATHLVHLHLFNIPHIAHILSEAMATCLPVLTRLETLDIGFGLPRGLADRLRHPVTRILLPALTLLRIYGIVKYPEDLVAPIDAPLLDKLEITFFPPRLPFDTPLLTQFISRTPNFKAHDEARLVFSDWDVSVILSQTFGRWLHLAIVGKQGVVSHLARLCSLSFPPSFIPAVEHLYILKDEICDWQDLVYNSQWLELLHPFASVKNIYITQELTPCIVLALQELVEERATEVLPALQILFLEELLPSGPVQEIIGQIVAARQVAGYPITVSRWKKE